jgi:hypothetical protein
MSKFELLTPDKVIEKLLCATGILHHISLLVSSARMWDNAVRVLRIYVYVHTHTGAL